MQVYHGLPRDIQNIVRDYLDKKDLNNRIRVANNKRLEYPHISRDSVDDGLFCWGTMGAVLTIILCMYSYTQPRNNVKFPINDEMANPHLRLRPNEQLYFRIDQLPKLSTHPRWTFTDFENDRVKLSFLPNASHAFISQCRYRPNYVDEENVKEIVDATLVPPYFSFRFQPYFAKRGVLFANTVMTCNATVRFTIHGAFTQRESNFRDRHDVFLRTHEIDWIDVLGPRNSNRTIQCTFASNLAKHRFSSCALKAFPDSIYLADGLNIVVTNTHNASDLYLTHIEFTDVNFYNYLPRSIVLLFLLSVTFLVLGIVGRYTSFYNTTYREHHEYLPDPLFRGTMWEMLKWELRPTPLPQLSLLAPSVFKRFN